MIASALIELRGKFSSRGSLAAVCKTSFHGGTDWGYRTFGAD
ncbi:hypothetical protein ACFQAT_07240 [Undibacterium arcticum]